MGVTTSLQKGAQSFISFGCKPSILILFTCIDIELPVNYLEWMLIFFSRLSSFLLTMLIPDLFLRRGGSANTGLRS